MTRLAKTTLFLLLAHALIAPFASAAERSSMEKVYNKWKTSMITKSYPAWAEATATHRQIMTNNMIVSQRQPFPKALFNMALRPPDVVQLRFVEERVNGDVGHLAYFGKANVGLGGDAIPDNLIIIRFVREEGAWKYDFMRFFNLAGIPEVRASIAAGNSTYLKTEDFALPDKAPPVPKKVDYPDYIGHIEVTSIGYQTAASVNGHSAGIVMNDRIVNIVIGGFEKGKNELHLEIEPIPDFPKWDRKLEVRAHVVTGKEDKPTVEIFSWEPEEDAPVPKVLDKEIWANATTIIGR